MEPDLENMFKPHQWYVWPPSHHQFTQF